MCLNWLYKSMTRTQGRKFTEKRKFIDCVKFGDWSRYTQIKRCGQSTRSHYLSSRWKHAERNCRWYSQHWSKPDEKLSSYQARREGENREETDRTQLRSQQADIWRESVLLAEGLGLKETLSVKRKRQPKRLAAHWGHQHVMTSMCRYLNVQVKVKRRTHFA